MLSKFNILGLSVLKERGNAVEIFLRSAGSAGGSGRFEEKIVVKTRGNAVEILHLGFLPFSRLPENRLV